MNSKINNLNSLRGIITWLSGERDVQYIKLKKLLLPFDYFPSVLIDQLNDKSMTLFDELVFDDDGAQYLINQEVLFELLSHVDEIDSLSSILDLTLNGRSNSIDGACSKLDSSIHSNSVQPIVALSTAGDDTYEEALNYYVPYGKYPQNEKEAMRLFKKAASLGCLDAYIDIADLYIDGGTFNGGSKFAQNYEKAIEYYIAGANKGSIYCYYRMGLLYAIYLNDEVNARKCFSLYTAKFIEKNINRNLIISDDNINTIASEVISQIYTIIDGDDNNLLQPVYHKLIIESAQVVSTEVIRHLNEAIVSTNGNARVVAALRYFENNLQDRLDT